jgi:hypothetical protein
MRRYHARLIEHLDSIPESCTRKAVYSSFPWYGHVALEKLAEPRPTLVHRVQLTYKRSVGSASTPKTLDRKPSTLNPNIQVSSSLGQAVNLLEFDNKMTTARK